MNTEALERLRAFRQEIYTTFGCRRDALVEMLDALLTSPVIEHPVHLSLAPGFQRTWGSVYDALNAGTMPLSRLEQLVATHPLETPTAWYAVDAVSGRGTMPTPVLSEATTTITSGHLMTSPSSLAGTTPGSCSSPSVAPVGPRPCACVGYGREKTSIR